MSCVCLLYRQYTSDYKLETYLKVARLYLEDEDPVQAEAYINRASLLQAESTREDLQIHYKVSRHRPPNPNHLALTPLVLTP